MTKFQIHWPERGIEHGEYTENAQNQTDEWRENKRLRRLLLKVAIIGRMISLVTFLVISVLTTEFLLSQSLVSAATLDPIWIFSIVAASTLAIDRFISKIFDNSLKSIVMLVTAIVAGLIIATWLKVRERVSEPDKNDLIMVATRSEMSIATELASSLKLVRKKKKIN